MISSLQITERKLCVEPVLLHSNENVSLDLLHRPIPSSGKSAVFKCLSFISSIISSLASHTLRAEQTMRLQTYLDLQKRSFNAKPWSYCSHFNPRTNSIKTVGVRFLKLPKTLRALCLLPEILFPIIVILFLESILWSWEIHWASLSKKLVRIVRNRLKNTSRARSILRSFEKRTPDMPSAVLVPVFWQRGVPDKSAYVNSLGITKTKQP